MFIISWFLHRTVHTQKGVFLSILGFKTYCCYDATSDKLKNNSEISKIRKLEPNREGLQAKHHTVMDEKVNLTSTSARFRTENQTNATYELNRKDSLKFIPNEVLRSM